MLTVLQLSWRRQNNCRPTCSRAMAIRNGYSQTNTTLPNCGNGDFNFFQLHRDIITWTWSQRDHVITRCHGLETQFQTSQSRGNVKVSISSRTWNQMSWSRTSASHLQVEQQLFFYTLTLGPNWFIQLRLPNFSVGRIKHWLFYWIWRYLLFEVRFISYL